ncbi:MAG: sulfurtransferase [Blastocatellia bacterium]|jgi:thiosulfate/3-mercaptopyruvate sulfurtransferase
MITSFILAAILTLGVSGQTVQANMLVSTDWLARHLNRSDTIILHIGPSREGYEKGHIPGARFVPLPELVTTRQEIPNELPPIQALHDLFTRLGIGNRDRIVLYAESNVLYASRAYFTLDYLGHGDRTSLLDGVLEQWIAEGRPLQTESPTYAPAPFTASPKPELIVSLDRMRDLSWATGQESPSSTLLIDARPEPQFLGGDAPRSGHIPGARNLFWMNHLRGSKEATFLPAADLQQLYQKLGLQPGQTVVTYCNSGMQASHSYFTLKYLGYPVRIYDGSISEWSKSPDAPMQAGTPAKQP